MNRYFLSAEIGDKVVEHEVTLREYCVAERRAGFWPKVFTNDSADEIPATASFSCGGMSGRIEYDNVEDL